MIPQHYLNSVVTGDARKLADAIPDESIDLIFTDPVYNRLEDYEWLAHTACRVLKPTGAVLLWSNGKWHYPNTRWLESAGLAWRYDFGCVIAVGPAPMCGKIIAKTNRIIWLDLNGRSKMLDYLADGYSSTTLPSLFSQWTWTKNPVFCQKALIAFTQPGALVFDPFTGGGTVPAVCKMLGRNYIAFEIDPDTATKARTRIANTQPPLFTLAPRQTRLDID